MNNQIKPFVKFQKSLRHMNEESVLKSVVKMGYVYKNKSLHAFEIDRFKCERKTNNMGIFSI